MRLTKMTRSLRLLAVAGTLAVGLLPITQAAASSLLQYQTANAPIQSAPVVYLVFWGVQWAQGWNDVALDTTNGLNVPTATVYSSNDSMNYITGFFKYIGGGGSTYLSSTAQYCQGVSVGATSCPAGATHVGNLAYGGSWVDTTSTPPPPVLPDCFLACLEGGISTDLLGQEALRAQTHFLGAGNNPSANFMIMLPEVTATPGYGVYCAYHSSLTDASGRPVSYTNMPYVMNMNVNSPVETAGCGENFVNPTDNSFGNGYMDGYSIVAGHEEGETMTDPQPGTATAWLDSGGQENGDKCAWIQPGTPGGAHDIGPDSSGHIYAVQSLWDNGASGCS